MNRILRREVLQESTPPAPSDVWLFVQAISENPLPDADSAQADIQWAREHLEWLAQVSTRHQDALHKLQRAEAIARRDREQLEWLAEISDEHAIQLQALLREEAAAREARQRFERSTEESYAQEDWDASKHPRRGGPPNAGWWATTGGSTSAASATDAATTFRAAVYRADKSKAQIVTVSDQSPRQSGASPSSGLPATKPHLPADHRGTGISGTKGHGVFRYNTSLENQRAGVAGKEVRFENQHIGVGGFPPESYYGGSAARATVTIESVTGKTADSRAADAKMREKLKDPNWQRPKGYRWNHAGEPGSRLMELVRESTHSGVAHRGPAATPRAEARSANARGAAGRAMGVFTVYLAVRDSAQATGFLKPDYEIAERETYHFRAEDGSVFVVHPGGLFFGSAKREYVEGPRKGQTETITNAEVEQHRKQAEAEFGKYIPGSLFNEPRFIPGKQRMSLPLIIYKYGIPHNAGWIDEQGVHYYSVARPLPI